jgi:hypothetical protein
MGEDRLDRASRPSAASSAARLAVQIVRAASQSRCLNNFEHMLRLVEIPKLGSPDSKTLVVLGAGASRGASFAHNSFLAPPLDRDFFQILQMSRTGRTQDGRDLLEHVRNAYGPALDISMEAVFSNLEAAGTFAHEVKIDPGPTVSWPEKMSDTFRRVLPQLLRETIGASECGYHLALARRLNTIDNVVSLNYDCLIDRALCEAALNWADSTSPLSLRTDIYDEVPEGVIQPPLANKPVTAEPFRAVWREARRSVRSARRLILIGYSMPITDGLVRSLLWTDLTSNLAEVIIVEPHAETRTRHVEFFTRLADQPKVYVFPSFQQLAAILED